MTSSMNYSLIAKQVGLSIFAIFLGAQITEAFLLVPYWQSLSAQEFYAYYENFGPTIGRFYTILTVAAALVPITVAVRRLFTKSDGVVYAILSALFAVLFILCFYIYFKSTNAQFYLRAFNEMNLGKELIVWSYWHWGRIGLEILSLIFLIMAFGKSTAREGSKG